MAKQLKFTRVRGGPPFGKKTLIFLNTTLTAAFGFLSATVGMVWAKQLYNWNCNHIHSVYTNGDQDEALLNPNIWSHLDQSPSRSSPTTRWQTWCLSWPQWEELLVSALGFLFGELSTQVSTQVSTALAVFMIDCVYNWNQKNFNRRNPQGCCSYI